MINKFFKKFIKIKRKGRKRRSGFMARLIPMKMLKNISTQFLVLALLTGLNWTGFWAVGMTVGFFNDTETSSGNGFTANYLDFDLSVHGFESFIGLGGTVSKNTVLVNSGGMDFQYTLEAEEVSDDDGLCDVLNLQAKLNSVEQYDGDLMSLATSASTTLGTWTFNIELPIDEDSFANGDECQFDVVFKGWQTNVPLYGDSGFSDEERMSFTITSGQMVVLNEFLPRPSGVAYGFNFGNDSSDMPQGEWVELYNNSTEAFDLTGWYIRDATDGDGNKTVITALNTAPATTTIAGKGWLVVYMNKAVYNNTGDTVRLFDNLSTLIDSHSYDVSDFCEIEPSPGASNSEDAFGGDCDDVPPNKSYARIPDGIGEWVDPIPTPGGVNVAEPVLEPVSSGGTIWQSVPDVVEEISQFVSGENNESENLEESGIVEEEQNVVEEEIGVKEEAIVEESTDSGTEEQVVTEEAAEGIIVEENVTDENLAIEEESVVVEEETTSISEPEPDGSNSNQNNSEENINNEEVIPLP